jgi:hypothetical protein
MDPNLGKSDHSNIGIDLNLGALISRSDLRDVDPTHPQGRALVSSDIKASKKFLDDLKVKQDAHNIHHRMRTLVKCCDDNQRCSEDDARLFQKLCDQMNMNAKQAEATCKKVGGYAWSHMLANAGQTIQIIKRELTRLIRGGPPTDPSDDRNSAIQ